MTIQLVQLLASTILALIVGIFAGKVFFCKPPIVDRRAVPFAADSQKFATQRNITYLLIGVFIGVCIQVLALGTDQSERSIIIQTVINLVLLAVGFWLGSSKQSQDQTQAAIARDTAATIPGSSPTVSVVTDSTTVNAAAERKD